MKYRKYQDIERFGNDEVQDIEFGECFVFPKLDGTNACTWLSDGEVQAGSRKRHLTLEKDNAGFYAHILGQDNIKAYLKKHPTHRLYGEFLVPHSLKTYREDAWRKFYVFDVVVDIDEDTVEHLPYEVYKPLLEEFDIEYIAPLAKITNPTYDSLLKALDKNDYLIKDGAGVGEGIVVKNYGFRNRFGRQTWAKITTSQFKEKHIKEMGCPEIKAKEMVEQRIVDEFCTEELIEKEYSKIKSEQDGWSSKLIPMLLGRVFHELIKDEMWNILKKHKNPKIDFRTLNTLTIQKVKQVKADLF